MAQDSGFDPDAIAQNHTFLQMGLNDKIGYLSSQDQTFSGMSRANQIGYIQHLTLNAQKLPPAPPSAWSQATTAIGNTLSTLGKAAFATGFGGSEQMDTKPPGIDDNTWDNMTREQRVAAIKATPEVPSDWQQRTAAGNSLPYRLAAAAGPTLGVDVKAAEQGGTTGNAGQVVGATLPAAVMAASPLVTEGASALANRVLPSKARAGAGMTMLTDAPEGAFAQRPISTPNANEVAYKVNDELSAADQRPHQLIDQHLNKEELRNLPPDHPDAMEPMNFLEARRLLKRVNDTIQSKGGFLASSEDKLVVPQLKRFAGALDQDISEAASREGFGQDYQAMKDEYRRASTIERVADTAGVPTFSYLGYKAGRMAGEPVGGVLIGGSIGKQVGKATVGKAARAITEREAGPPTLQSIPSTPEAYQRAVLSTDSKRMQAERIMLDAKEGRISPQESTRRLQKLGVSVKTRPIPKQPPRKNAWAYQSAEPPF